MAFDDPNWTLNEAVVWAMWRIREAVEAVASGDHPYELSEWDETPAFPGFVQQMDIAEAENSVRRLMQEGQIEAMAEGRVLTRAEIAAAGITESNGELQLVAGRPFNDLRLDAEQCRSKLPGLELKPAPVLRLVASNSSISAEPLSRETDTAMPPELASAIDASNRARKVILLAAWEKWKGPQPEYLSIGERNKALLAQMHELNPDLATNKTGPDRGTFRSAMKIYDAAFCSSMQQHSS